MALLIASLILAGTLAASQPSQLAPQMAEVSGQVMEEGTRTPVAGATVFLVYDSQLPPDAGSPPTTVTDRDGHYQFETVPAGRVRLPVPKGEVAPPLDPSAMA